MNNPTDVLRAEHDVILEALDVLEVAARRLAGGGTLPEGWWDRIVAWLRAFADRNHHAKEENSLFPAMLAAGLPSEGGPVQVMLAEHTQGRAFIAAMTTGDARTRAARAQDYVQLLRQHIDKENGILFPLADAVISEPAMKSVAREFDVVAMEQGKDAAIPDAQAAVAALRSALG